VSPDRVPFGLPLADACELVGVTVGDYLANATGTAAPFVGVGEMLGMLPRWAVCSNKLGAYARREIEVLGWHPEIALFSEDFGGPKRLQPVLDELRVGAADVVFVGDSEYDRRCAREAGAAFALAGWNARATAEPGDVVLSEPHDVLTLIA
jgi:phosphoglycolate phosphatase-like HAD superfamily hydrolase